MRETKWNCSKKVVSMILMSFTLFNINALADDPLTPTFFDGEHMYIGNSTKILFSRKGRRYLSISINPRRPSGFSLMAQY